jgi:uncharacterized protein (DUF2384 family)
MVKPEFTVVPNNIAKLMRERVCLPDDAIETYLVRARNKGWVTQGRDSWISSNLLISTIHEAKKLRERPSTRRKQLSEIIGNLLEIIPQADRQGFDQGVWWRQKNASFGRSPLAAIDLDDAEWAEFVKLFVNLKDDLRLRPDRVLDTFGLPVAAERDRLVAKRRQKMEERRRAEEDRLAAAAEQRFKEIKTKAELEFGPLANEFLEKKFESLGQRTPAEASRNSGDLHSRALLILSGQVETRRNEKFSESVRMAALDRLEAQAQAVLGGFEPAQKWMEGENSLLGGKSPKVFCSSKARLEECQSALRRLESQAKTAD